MGKPPESQKRVFQSILLSMPLPGNACQEKNHLWTYGFVVLSTSGFVHKWFCPQVGLRLFLNLAGQLRRSREQRPSMCWTMVQRIWLPLSGPAVPMWQGCGPVRFPFPTRPTTGTAATPPPGAQKKPLPKSVTNHKTASEASLQASLSIWLHFVTLNPVKVSALSCSGKLSEIGVTKCNQHPVKWY